MVVCPCCNASGPKQGRTNLAEPAQSYHTPKVVWRQGAGPRDFADPILHVIQQGQALSSKIPVAGCTSVEALANPADELHRSLIKSDHPAMGFPPYEVGLYCRRSSSVGMLDPAPLRVMQIEAAVAASNTQNELYEQVIIQQIQSL